MIAGKSLQGWLDRADALGAEGRFFDAHEELELAWKASDGETKILLQGLIQISAGLHRWGLHPEKTEGAFYLLDRGVDKIRRMAALLTPDSLALLANELKSLRKRGAPPKTLRFRLRAR